MGRAAVVGVFHCNLVLDAREVLHGDVGPADVPGSAGERFAVYAHGARTLNLVRFEEHARSAACRTIMKKH